YGVFSANNTPDPANFPNGVTFLRNANFTTHQLLNVDNTTPVAISIDPFFFEVKGTKVPNDYDGDGKTDFAVWQIGEATWHVIDRSVGVSRVQVWCVGRDTQVPSDYDGDGKTDFAVWRPSEGNWYVIDSSTGATRVQQWGLGGDIPVPGDYDGDGKTDFAVWRPSEGNWYAIDSSTGATRVQQWGMSGDTPRDDYLHGYPTTAILLCLL